MSKIDFSEGVYHLVYTMAIYFWLPQNWQRTHASTLVNYREPIPLYRGCWASILSLFPLTRPPENFVQFLQTLFKVLQHELLPTEKLTKVRLLFLTLLKRFFFWGYRKATLVWNVLTKIKIKRENFNPMKFFIFWWLF